MYRRDLFSLLVSQPNKSPRQQENIEPLSAGCTLPQSPHSCHPGQYHRPNYSNIDQRLYVDHYFRASYYWVLNGKAKSAEEEDPSAETLSVVVREAAPPNSKTSPEGSDQQVCLYLFCTRVTVSGVKVPSASNFTQDR